MLVDKTDANTGRMRLARNLDKLQRRWHMRRRLVCQRKKQRMQQLNAKKTYTAAAKALRCNDWRRHQDQNSWPRTLGDHFQPTWRREDDERLRKMMWVRNTRERRIRSKTGNILWWSPPRKARRKSQFGGPHALLRRSSPGAARLGCGDMVGPVTPKGIRTEAVSLHGRRSGFRQHVQRHHSAGPWRMGKFMLLQFGRGL